MTRLPVGGVEHQLFLVLKHYDKSRVLPVVCSLSDTGEVGREIAAAGIEVISLNKLAHGFDYSIVRDLRRIIRQRNIHVVRTHQYHANLYGRIAAIIEKVPCIVASVHNIYTRDRKIHRRIINQILAGLTDKVVAVSEAVRRDIVAYDHVSADKVMVIHNGIELARFSGTDGSAVRREFGIRPDSTVIGTVGRLTEQKGHKYLFEAFAATVRGFPQLRLLIVGDGPQRAVLEQTAESLNIRDKVIFTGTRRDVPPMLAAMDVFVFPSLWEGMPNALAEAMAAGLPIIASDIPQNRELIDHEKSGLVFTSGSSDAMVLMLKRMLEHMHLAKELGRAARTRIAESFIIEQTINRYMACFQEILRGKGVV